MYNCFDNTIFFFGFIFFEVNNFILRLIHKCYFPLIHVLMNKLVFYFINLENNILKEIILKIKLKTFLSIYLCKYNQRIKLFRNFIDNQSINI